MLISVIQGLKLQGLPFYLIYTDVKGAFPGVPTEFMGQRYNSMGIEDSDRLFTFLQAIDVNTGGWRGLHFRFFNGSVCDSVGWRGPAVPPGRFRRGTRGWSG